MSKRNDALAHYGVRGMKWGHRKSVAESGDGWKIHPDGRIDIDAGATLSRVVRNHSGLFGGTGATLDSGKPIYAAFKPKDMNDYAYFFGSSKSLLVKEASTILKLTPSVPLKAPGPKEASSIYFGMLKNDPALKEQVRSGLHGLAKARLDKAISDPTSKQAYEVYNIALDSANYSQKHNSVNQKYFDAVKQKGYNMLLDGSDATGGFDAPVIVLDGGNLKIHSQSTVDKASSTKARLLYKEQSAIQGKLYLEKLGYL